MQSYPQCAILLWITFSMLGLKGEIMETQEIWNAALGELEVILSKANYTTWFKGANLIDINNQSATITVRNNFFKEWFENKYHPHILKVLNRLTNGKILNITYQVGTVVENKKIEEKTKTQLKIEKKDGLSGSEVINISTQKENKNAQSRLKPEHTFETFVVGTTNRLAYAASQAVVNKPGKAHNPLVIYGGVGLGKTHLIHAIGNEIKSKHPHLNLLYTSCEDFANEFVQSIQGKKTNSFKKKYRSMDVFLVDDIQFLSRKEGTQEEFFHTFNALHQNNCQIVMTSDKIPTAIPNLEDRLSSRFAMGMVADIQIPDFETRQAILKFKAKQMDIKIEPEIIELIAENITNNVRELEGALNRLIAYCKLHNTLIDIDITKEALKDILGKKATRTFSGDYVVNCICNYFDLKKAIIMGKGRQKDIVHARHICMYLVRSELGMSYPEIGALLGGKDHTTIIHGVKTVERELAKNENLRNELSQIRSILYTEK